MRTGRYHPRSPTRWTSNVREANARLSPEEPVNYDETAFGESHVNALSEGHALRYRNAVESNQNIDPDTPTKRESVAIPSSGYTTWDRDVLHPKSGASGMAQDFARQRIERGSEGAVGFPSMTANPHAYQPSLFGGGVRAIRGEEHSTLSSIQFTTQPDE